MTRVRNILSEQLRIDIAVALLILAGNNANVIDGQGEERERPLTSESDSSAAQEQNISIDSSSASSSTPLQQQLTEVREILTCLFRLLPALLDPAPHDTRNKARNPGGDIFDLSHVKSKFPQANPELLNRLGSANWKRRQQLMVLRAQDEAGIEEENDHIKAIVSPTGHEEGDDLSAANILHDSQSEQVTQRSQVAGEWTSSSGFASGISTALTSVSNNPIPKSHALDRATMGFEAQRLKLPRPPEPNSSFDGQQFRCPFCFHCLVAISSFSAWK